MTTDAARLIAAVRARAIAPRKPLTVSEWADRHRVLSAKGSAEAGRWRTDRNPPLREPMDCMSARSPVRDVAMVFPIQFGKTEVEINALGYTMCEVGGPIMVCLSGEVSMNKWVNQKLGPMFETTPAVRAMLSSTKSRDSANQREFKDFAGGQLYLEHAGSPSRLKSTSVRTLLVDEEDEFAANLTTGDDPGDLLAGRTSAFPATSRRMFISTPTIEGHSRIAARYDASDRRRYHVACPHCGHEQHLQWSGLHWRKSIAGEVEAAWYVCADCGALIDEHHKTDMIRRGRWIAANPGARVRGYHINCLYYQIGLGPRWAELAQMWLDAQGDPAKLKTFINDRLAETFEDPALRAVKHHIIADRAEPYALRTAPAGALVLTAGIDTQDDRLEVQIVGWGRGLRRWVIDYAVLPGDPAGDDVWLALTELLNRPVQHESGALLSVQAAFSDAGGHRTEHVYNWVRTRKVRRPVAIFGAKHNNAPVLNKGTLVDVTWRGKTDKRGLRIYHVGTVAAKHHFYSLLSKDADLEPEERMCHFSDDLPPEYFAGLVSERFNPSKNRFENPRGARNEAGDTMTYAYAATHHPELRLHRYTDADWTRLERTLIAKTQATTEPAEQERAAQQDDNRGTQQPRPARAPRMPRNRYPKGW